MRLFQSVCYLCTAAVISLMSSNTMAVELDHWPAEARKTLDTMIEANRNNFV